jgi:hypothetical protein
MFPHGRLPVSADASPLGKTEDFQMIVAFEPLMLSASAA